MKKISLLFLIAAVVCAVLLPVRCSTAVLASPAERNCLESNNIEVSSYEPIDEEPAPKKFIKWIDFNISKDILARAREGHQALLKLGITDIGTCELLAYIALKNGNSFRISTDTANLNKLMTELKNGNRAGIEKYKENKYFNYYVESYHAILDGIINPQTAEVTGFHPIAKGFWFNCYDDFGNSRGYGYKRRHLGHDLFGGVGSPIIAVEGGTVTELGWNQYGGWRIGIRSDCTKRYYYYAHLRKNRPFAADLKLGDKVEAGQVIGYLGVTGYSRKENTNMTTTNPHLHFGIQIIFDKSQEDGPGEIWIDVHALCQFLTRNRVKVIKNSETKEYSAEKKAL